MIANRREKLMRGNKKSNLQYWFTVEGDTEKWYLDHVQRVLNNSDETIKSVHIESKVCKSPKSFVKNTTALITPEITHLCDIESNSPEHLNNFSNILSELAFAKKQKGIKYELGYSNYTFELWIILHKQQLKASLSDRSQYLNYINASYSQSFSSMSEYKEKDNFQKVLDRIDLNSIMLAIKHAEDIEKQNKENRVRSKSEYGIKFYLDNPSLSIHTRIKRILEDCKLL